MNEAIERGAQAAYMAGNPNDTAGWARVPPDKQEWWRIVVSAAFKTLHEPTRNQMLAASFILQQATPDLVTRINRALVDKATDPKG